MIMIMISDNNHIVDDDLYNKHLYSNTINSNHNITTNGNTTGMFRSPQEGQPRDRKCLFVCLLSDTSLIECLLRALSMATNQFP